MHVGTLEVRAVTIEFALRMDVETRRTKVARGKFPTVIRYSVAAYFRRLINPKS